MSAQVSERRRLTAQAIKVLVAAQELNAARREIEGPRAIERHARVHAAREAHYQALQEYFHAAEEPHL